MKTGQIYKIHSDFYYVFNESSRYECKMREVLKKQGKKILVGDFVEFNESNFIENIVERKNSISRPSVANIDQIVVVSALKEPDLNFSQLNRYIALAKFHNIPFVLCFNKSDLHCDRQVKNKILSVYGKNQIIFTSALEHKGLKEFKSILKGKVSVLCGGSGAGKSSLVNAVNPNINLKTGQVSQKTQRGTHTTRHCELIQFEQDSYIVDTPGFSNVKFDFIMPQDVDLLFDEISIYRDRCKYSDCLHINEDGCSVLANLDKIDLSRYESYLALVEEAKSYKDRIKFNGSKTENRKKMLNDKEVAKISEKKRKNSRNNVKQEIYKEIE